MKKVKKIIGWIGLITLGFGGMFVPAVYNLGFTLEAILVTLASLFTMAVFGGLVSLFAWWTLYE